MAWSLVKTIEYLTGNKKRPLGDNTPAHGLPGLRVGNPGHIAQGRPTTPPRRITRG